MCAFRSEVRYYPASDPRGMSVTEIDNGLNTWQLMTNHNKMIELQKKLYDGEALPSEAPVELAFFGSSAFRATSPAGISVMCDPVSYTHLTLPTILLV